MPSLPDFFVLLHGVFGHMSDVLLSDKINWLKFSASKVLQNIHIVLDDSHVRVGEGFEL